MFWACVEISRFFFLVPAEVTFMRVGEVGSIRLEVSGFCFICIKWIKTLPGCSAGLKAAAVCVILCRWREGAASLGEAEHLS